MKITGGGVIALAGLAAVAGAVYVVRKNAGALNPASHDNIVYKAAEPALNYQIGGYAASDYYFAYLDLLNPWNESDEYARQVWGLNRERWF